MPKTQRSSSNKTTAQKTAISAFQRASHEAEQAEIELLRREQESITLTSKVERVTADIAAKYLRTMMINRDRNGSRIASYARMMLSGEWGLTNASIAFTIDGYLCDGQHRLLALIQASKTNPEIAINTVVVRGVDRDCVRYIDNGQSRTSLQNFKIAGVSTQGLNKKISACKAMFMGGYLTKNTSTERVNTTLSNGQLFTLMEKHDKALSFAITLNSGKANKAPIHAVIARAYYHHEDELTRLSQFVEVLNTNFPIAGNPPGFDDSAIALWHFANNTKGSNGQARLLLYKVTEFALSNFMQCVGYREITERDVIGQKEQYPIADFDG